MKVLQDLNIFKFMLWLSMKPNFSIKHFLSKSWFTSFHLLSRLLFLIVSPKMKTLVFSICIVKAKLTMSVASFSKVLPILKLSISWCKITVSRDISSRHPFTWCIIPFVEVPGIDLTETLDFILLFKRQPATCFKMESPTKRVFFVGTFMDFELFKGPYVEQSCYFFNFLLLLLFAIACKWSSWDCEPEG